jgi:hypothetical protein
LAVSIATTAWRSATGATASAQATTASALATTLTATGAALTTALTRTGASLTAAGATLAATWAARRACLFQDFHLLRGEDLGQLFLHFLFQIGDLLLLIVGQVHLLLGKPRDHVNAAAGRPARGTAGSRAARRAAAILLRRRGWGVRLVIGAGPSDQRQTAENGHCQQEHRDTPHYGLLAAKGGGKVR